MAHREQRKFCEEVKRRFPSLFCSRRVLDVGSLDINGNNRSLFADCEYVGLDIQPGRNVTLVCKAHEYEAPDSTFDTVISTEALEHDMFYPQSLANMARILRPAGLLVVTCATTSRPEHGTRRSAPQTSPFTANIQGWCDYYKNLTEADIRTVLDVDSIFSAFEFRVEPRAHDLYFWGVKRAQQCEEQR